MTLLHTWLLLSYHQTRPLSYFFMPVCSRAILQERPSFCKNRNLTHYLNTWNAIRFWFFFFKYEKMNLWYTYFCFLHEKKLHQFLATLLNETNFSLTFWQWNKNNTVQLYQPPYLASQLIFFLEKNFRTARWMAKHIHQPQARNKRVAK